MVFGLLIENELVFWFVVNGLMGIGYINYMILEGD